VVNAEGVLFDAFDRARMHVAAPKIVRLEKRGDTITLFVSMNEEPLHPTDASIKLHFEEPFYVGLGVASHQDGQLEKAAFSHVELKPLNAVATAYVALERPKITGLSHLAVYTSNPEGTEHFYREVIGAVKLSDPENPQGVRYALSDSQFIEVLPLPAGAGINRLDHSAWNTENAEQLRRYLAANNWKTYSYQEENFSAEFPGVPKAKNMTVDNRQWVRGIQYIASDAGSEYIRRGEHRHQCHESAVASAIDTDLFRIDTVL